MLLVEAFIPQLPVEAFAVAVLPRTSRLDIQRPGTNLRQPLPQLLRYELRAVVRTNVFRDSPEQHHICQSFNHFIPPEPSRYTDGQTLPRVFIDERQHPQCSSVMRHCAHEVVAPNVIRTLRPHSHARRVVQPQPPARPLFLRHLQLLATPDTLYPIFAHVPTITLHHRPNSPVAVATVFPSHAHYPSPHP